MIYDISIQIVNYKTKIYLEECLHGLLNDLRQVDFTYSINILDNASGDLIDELKMLAPERISIYYSNKNLGYGGGHNFLSKKTSSNFILILNPDLKFISSNIVQSLFQYITTHNNVKVIGPKIVSDKTDENIDHGELRGFKAWLENNLGGCYYKPRNVITNVAWMCGAFFLVEREAFEHLKGFDENFFLYKEEEDLCKRIRDNGGKIVYYPFVKVFHYNSIVAKKTEHYDNSFKYYVKKHYERKILHKVLKFIRLVYRYFFKRKDYKK